MADDPPDNLQKHQPTFSAGTGEDVDVATHDAQGPPTASWIGDMPVRDVSPHRCWVTGRKQAEALVTRGKEAHIKDPDFAMFAPLGRVLIDAQDAGAVFEPDAELVRDPKGV
ncbi:hypothetical protein C8R46DRAFT_1227768 [Mycena filopes]|nr:hypothetical protein C8R46DRAFT_1227768 [Mycena filopes]